jgi:uncharacterized membrane protein
VARGNYRLLIGCHGTVDVVAVMIAVVVVVVVIVAVIIGGCVWGRRHSGCWLAHVETVPQCHELCAQTAQALL